MRPEPLSTEYEALLGRLREACEVGSGVVDAYLACVTDHVLRARMGEPQQSPVMTLAIRREIGAAFCRDFGWEVSEVAARAEELRKAVTTAARPSDVPERTTEGILDFWLERLQVECLRIHLKSTGADLPNALALLGDTEDRWCALKASFSRLPCPQGMSVRARAISERLFLQGSPLFGWWDPVEDAERLAGLLVSPRKPQTKSSHWEKAPNPVQHWDLKIVQRGASRLEPSNETMDPDQTNLRPFTRHLNPSNRKAVIPLFPRGTDLPVARAAASELVRGTAHFPFAVTEARTAPLILESEGVREDAWRVKARLGHVLSVSQTQGKVLSRLTARDPRTYEHIASAAAEDLRTCDHWTVELPLGALSGIWLLVRLEKPEQKEAILSELLAKAPDELFLWVLGEEGDERRKV